MPLIPDSITGHLFKFSDKSICHMICSDSIKREARKDGKRTESAKNTDIHVHAKRNKKKHNMQKKI